MKNLFKFGFLGLAIAVGTAACSSNSTKNETERKTDSLESVVAGKIQAEKDSLKKIDTIDSIGKKVVDSVDTAAKK